MNEFDIFQQEPFRELREKYPERLKKLVVVPGEITEDGLALTASDKERIMKEISVVFHTAANVKFDLPLKTAIITNTKSTMNILALAKEVIIIFLEVLIGCKIFETNPIKNEINF